MPRVLLGLTFVSAGVLHFLRPRVYEAIMPRYLPAHRELVYASGLAEIAGGAGMLHPRTRRPAGWWLIATLVAIFPPTSRWRCTPSASALSQSRCCGRGCRSRAR